VKQSPTAATKYFSKVAIVTGGGSGIGRAVALALVADGYAVVVAGRRTAPLRSAVREMEEKGGRGLGVRADVSDPVSVRALFTKTRKVFGRLDLLFNNAGITGPTAPLEEISFEDWRAVVDTNLTGAFLCTQEAILMMKGQSPQGGRIINNGSISAHSPRPNAGPYTATKHAITGLTKSTSLEGRRYNIACGQIDIGNASTEMSQRLIKAAAATGAGGPAEPAIDVSHIADAVLYMARLPLEANVQFMTVMSTKMPFIGRG
jgi:NAD(P)-dependent dehydrogenase (short-subunit alcohol dehydrogenase family)